MTIRQLEQLEERAQRGLPIGSEHILNLTAYLRDVLQQKASAEAVAAEALKRVGLDSQFSTAAIRRVS